MGTAEEERDAMALGIVELIVKMLPGVGAFGERSAKMSRALWPRGAPKRVTWGLVLDAEVARVNKTMDDIVLADQARLGGEVRREALLRMQAVHVLSEQAAVKPMRFLDEALERDEGRRHLGELFTMSRGVLAAACSVIVERHNAGQAGTLELAQSALQMFRELLVGVVICARVIHDKEVVETFSALVKSVDEVAAEAGALDGGPPAAPVTQEEMDRAFGVEAQAADDAEGDEPEVAPPADEVAPTLLRLCGALRPLQARIAEAFVDTTFQGAPPEALTWTIAMQAMLATAGVHLELRATETFEKTDEILFKDGPAGSVEELVDHTLNSVEGAAESLADTQADEFERVATNVWLLGKLMLLNVTSIAQASGLHLEVVDVAAELGLDPLEDD